MPRAGGRGAIPLHLAEVIALRAVPAAGVIFELTRRCPLNCAHCSTSSTMASAEHAGDPFVRLARSFTVEDRPDVVAMTGGEPLLRSELVCEIAGEAAESGARVHVLTGMFFARGRTIPLGIRRALAAVDHVSASLDAFHEREVPRAAVFRVFDELLADGKAVSLQIVGVDGADPYVAALVDDVRRAFDDRVPMLVSMLRPEGRARDWLADDSAAAGEDPVEPSPCTMAAWPVVCADGRVTACCNQAVVDGAALAHLRLGDAAVDAWPVLRARCQSRPSLQAIRALGPRYVGERLGVERCSGYCTTCHRLGAVDGPSGVALGDSRLRPEFLRALDAYVAATDRRDGAIRFAERFGLGAYAPLVALGYDEAVQWPAG